MKDKDFKALRDECCSERYELADAKSKEYADDFDRLSNFKRLGSMSGATPEQTLLIYMVKHIDSISTFIKKGCVDEGTESIIGRIYDSQNYLDLLIGLLKEEK